jgi:phage protein D
MTVRDRSAPMLLVRLQDQNNEYRVVTDSVLSFSYTDAERKTDTVKITVDNSNLEQFDDPVWRKGGRIRVSWGYPGAMAPERTCVITSVKGFRELSIEANGEDVTMNTIQRQRSFESMTISQIAEQIADEYGFGPDVRFIDDTGERRLIVAQANLTDAQFLRQRASEEGFEFYVDFDGFHFHERRLGEPPVRVLRYFIDQGAGDFIGDPSIENDLTARPGRVRARGRNPRTRTDIDVAADNASDNHRDTLAETVELIDPDTGDASTVEHRVASESTIRTPASNDERASRGARGRFRRAQQVAVKMTCSIIGDPTLLAKTIVQVEGMGRRLSVKYYITEVTHDLAPSGYECKLKMVSDGHGGHSTVSRQAEGLSMIGVQQQRSNRSRGGGSSGDVAGRLSRALSAARAAGDTDSVRALERAQRAYQGGGNANRAEVSRALDQVARNPNASSEVRGEAAAARGELNQRGAETASGGRPNRNVANDRENDSLEPVEVIDPDSGASMIRYNQTPGRGSTPRSSR